MLKLVVNDFECYRDEAEYFGQRGINRLLALDYSFYWKLIWYILVSFYKRVQILVGDIWACFKGQSYGAFTDINYITMFADYRVPQVLIHFGTMTYSNDLLNKLKSGKSWVILKNSVSETILKNYCI